MKLNMHRVGDIVEMVAEGEPSELAAYAKACGLLPEAKITIQSRIDSHVNCRKALIVQGTAIVPRTCSECGISGACKFNYP